MSQIYHFVNGILTFPGCSDSWNRRAMEWYARFTARKALDVEYICGPVTRALFNRRRASKLHAQMTLFAGWDQTVVAHSNGADVLVDALQMFTLPSVRRVHLVCAACEADFNRNGLNRHLLSGKVGQVSIYVAERDLALRLAHTLPARLLGYGVLGLHGPVNVLPSVREHVRVVRWGGFGHSTCWDGAHFDDTMRLFL